jgi:hypothetical protein
MEAHVESNSLATFAFGAKRCGDEPDIADAAVKFLRV